MTSIWEGFGNVLVEAMAAGCRIISTDCDSGPSEILGGGKYGVLVPVNDPISLANAIQCEKNNPRNSYSWEEMLSPFTFENIGNQYISLFSEVVNYKTEA
jgi:glycosyltransferase involved in cell wall biosynthesis